jgi:pimeloyl-ACP methyl ester carboxylesterase
MIDRRTFSATLAAGVTALLLGIQKARAAIPVRNVVLVHGLYADGSSWSEVIVRLQSAGMRVTAVQNPLTSFTDDVAAVRRALAMQDGPTVLAAHSYGGMVATEAGADPKVTALVYVAARAPDAGEDYTALAKRFPTPPASAGLVKSGDYVQLNEDAFLNDFANGVDPVKARELYQFKRRMWRRCLPRPRRRSLRGDRNLHGTQYQGMTERSTQSSSASWRRA